MIITDEGIRDEDCEKAERKKLPIALQGISENSGKTLDTGQGSM